MELLSISTFSLFFWRQKHMQLSTFGFAHPSVITDSQVLTNRKTPICADRESHEGRMRLWQFWIRFEARSVRLSPGLSVDVHSIRKQNFQSPTQSRPELIPWPIHPSIHHPGFPADLKKSAIVKSATNRGPCSGSGNLGKAVGTRRTQGRVWVLGFLTLLLSNSGKSFDRAFEGVGVSNGNGVMYGGNEICDSQSLSKAFLRPFT
ncbi:hypothetical protein B0H65DRAFT_222779 [Neurospora tetraspora]|uniref:Uncharacterized protein n=1 Tax=Neurospora tetraspora TaxID=94610 RepID=A0AAE0JCB6_9PEZI|nr:hypothetical protein B0H65DRAFT_222779 [Neurospora tetraspora]